jgi:hypothetical protein
MSTSAVKKLTRTYHITHTSWSGGVLTINTDIPHYMVAGDEVKLLFNNGPQILSSIVSNTGTVGTSKSFTVPCPVNLFVNSGEVELDYFTGAMLSSSVNSMGLGNGVLGVLGVGFYNDTHKVAQFRTTAATSGGAIDISGSLDGKVFSQILYNIGGVLAGESNPIIGIPSNSGIIIPRIEKLPYYRFTVSTTVAGSLSTLGRLYITMS